MKDLSIARRELLRRLGVGAACLPLLRARRARAAAPRPPRLILIEMINGYRQAYWKPAIGPLQTLPPTSAAFTPVESQMIFLPDLTNPPAGNRGREAFGVMFYGLDDVASNGLYKEPRGKTLDQFVGGALPHPPGARLSLNLGVQVDLPPHPTTAPGGTYCFWSGPGQPIKPALDPYAVYGELFTGATGDPSAARRLMARRKSILDYVGSNLEDFKARAGTEDREQIDAHLQSLRELELRVQQVPNGASCQPPSRRPQLDLAASANYPLILDAQLRLMVVALQCGVTGVATLQTSDAAGLNIDFGAFVPGLPARGTGYKSQYRNWADLSHNPVFDGVDHKKIVEQWFFERFNTMLTQLRATLEDDGNLLDRTIVVIGNDMHEGADRLAQAIPWMIAGNCEGRLATGQCLDGHGHSIASVMAGICQALGIDQHPYGSPMPGLLR